MRIVIDFQAAQSTGSRNRGIGRYSLSLAQAMIRNRAGHEIVLALNDHFPEAVESIRSLFSKLIPQENIRVWSAVRPVSSCDTGNTGRREAAELVREAFLASLQPDVVHVTSLFEGLGDDAVTSVGLLSQSIPTAVTLYDLIPYIYRQPYLENPIVESWYLHKIEHLKRADLWLAISESSRREGLSCLGLADDRTINIAADADDHFQSRNISVEAEHDLRQRYGLQRPFVMYTGGIDHRKNIEGLIRSFSMLSTTLRKSHQLAIVCSIQPESRHMLAKLAERHGMSKDELVLPGYVSDDDLVALYNLCTLFVFPSWHEGFGLPALEAMRCGAPVIAADSSSLPEVVGWQEALFTPQSDEAMAKKMTYALTDDAFRAELVRRGTEQAKEFSWDKSAKLAIAAMECTVADIRARNAAETIVRSRPKLAYVSPLPPEQTGIADYSALLLPELSRHYQIEVIVAQNRVSDPWIQARCPIRSVQWFLENAGQFDRILYHFGNSRFHRHMFDLLKVIPGVVVLHDFFLSGIVSSIPEKWPLELYASHGYNAINDFLNDDIASTWKYPCNATVIKDSLGVVVHSPYSLVLAKTFFGNRPIHGEVIPLLRERPATIDKSAARSNLGFSNEDFVVCSFGMIGPTKHSQDLLRAWLDSSLARDTACHLVFVGKNVSGEYGDELVATINKSRLGENVQITGWVEKEIFCQYLAAADLGVQLRTLSRGETSASVLDCMSYGLATIVNANGSMTYLDKQAVKMLPELFTDEELIDAIEMLKRETALRNALSVRAKNIVLKNHDPQSCSKQYIESIEKFYQFYDVSYKILPKAIASTTFSKCDDSDVTALSSAIANSFPERALQKQILVDISILSQSDARSGIQRVVRSILNEWLQNPPVGYRIEPVYATTTRGFRYARNFTCNFLKYPYAIGEDEPVDFSPEDIFFGLDLAPQYVIQYDYFLHHMHRHGVRVLFMVYDLLPIIFPHFWKNNSKLISLHEQWLHTIIKYEGAVCISRAVASELTNWMTAEGLYQKNFDIHWFHLGADICNSVPSLSTPDENYPTLDKLCRGTTFLMVGTLEPRKGHAQVLDAFEQLWKERDDVRLIIVGKEGWLADDLVSRIKGHPQLKKHLLWMQSISDEYLEKVYAASTCLIAASYGEGFGLPLIEAAQHKLPIIARDIPVFREVAGEHAYYFKGTTANVLARSILTWLELYASGRQPTSNTMPWLTWKESAASLLRCIIQDSPVN